MPLWFCFNPVFAKVKYGTQWMEVLSSTRSALFWHCFFEMLLKGEGFMREAVVQQRKEA